jgi:assimilatory nitrate reductase catalytic subunit
VLRSLGEQEPYVEISPEDAAVRELAGRDWTVVTSARGSMRARALITSTVAPGQVFVPMHYCETNRLTSRSFDPYSRQPSYKSGAVEVRRARRRQR